MMLPQLYVEIRSNVEAHNILARVFDIELVTPSQNHAQNQVQSPTDLTVVATEGAGGFFALVGTAEVESRPVIFVSSEGQAGKVTYNFKVLIELIVSCPYWFDLLKFSGGGKIDEMRKAQIFLEKELEEDEPSFEQKQSRLLNILQIQKMKDPVKNLHEAAVLDLSEKIISKDGYSFDVLFSKRVVDDNPMWKRIMEL